MPNIAKLQGYPELRRLVTNSISRLVVLNPKAFRAFVKWSTLDPQQARIALLPDAGPRIIVRQDLVGPELQLRPDAIRGYARYTGSDFIVIREDFANQYETAAMAGVPSVNLLMESKILHELVHWGYKQRNGTLEPIILERGWAFEKDAYGRELTATKLGLLDFIVVAGNP